MATENVKGLRELGEALKAFGAILGKRYLARATSATAAVFRDEAKSLAPFKSGNLRDNIVIFKRTADGNTAHYAVGVRPIHLTAKSKKVLRILKRATGHRASIEGDPFYWRFLEFGTSKMAARPFLRPAFESKKQDAVETFKKSLADGVDAAAAEARK
jgi:HK97 gp10 family phage protein